MQQQQQQPEAMLCLQAQQVAGLPDAAEGRHIQLSTTSTPALAAAVCRAGVADFHRQVLLLHCAPVSSVDDVAVTVTMLHANACNDHRHPAAARLIASVNVDLAEQLRRPSPTVLSFVLGAGAVLSLTLHHRLLVTTTTRTGCSSLLRSCLRVPLAAGCCPPVPTTKQNHRRLQHHQGPTEAAADDDGGGDGDSSSSGFITIEKGTISRRHPPSDYLLTTDDDEVDAKRPPGPGPPTTCCWSLSSLDDDTKVENDFLAMLMLEEEEQDNDDDLDLDALIKDAEADIPAIWPSRADDRRGASSAT